jgi:hypothetical protein
MLRHAHFDVKGGNLTFAASANSDRQSTKADLSRSIMSAATVIASNFGLTPSFVAIACAAVTFTLRAGSMAFGWSLPVHVSRPQGSKQGLRRPIVLVLRFASDPHDL